MYKLVLLVLASVLIKIGEFLARCRTAYMLNKVDMNLGAEPEIIHRRASKKEPL